MVDDMGSEYEYMFNGFKRKLEFRKGIIPDDMKLPLQTNLINVKQKFNIDDLKEFTEDHLNEDDRPSIYRSCIIDGLNLNFHFFYKIGPSPFFDKHYSINIASELILYFLYDNILFYYDSSNYLPINEKDIGILGSYYPEN